MSKWCDIFCSNKQSCDEDCPLYGKYYYNLEDWYLVEKEFNEDT